MMKSGQRWRKMSGKRMDEERNDDHILIFDFSKIHHECSMMLLKFAVDAKAKQLTLKEAED